MNINRQFRSPNFDPVQIPVGFLVLHYTAENLQSTLEIFMDTSRKVSSHLVINEDGQIYELVACLQGSTQRAWHAGQSHWVENGTCWVATPFQTGVQDPGQENPLVPVCNRSGDRVPSNPEHSLYAAIQQNWELGNYTPFVRLEYSYLGDTMTDGNNDPLKLRDSFSFVHARAGLRFESINAELALWARNLTDERFFETVFDVPVQGGKLNAYPHEPRTWGLSYRMHFD